MSELEFLEQLRELEQKIEIVQVTLNMEAYKSQWEAMSKELAELKEAEAVTRNSLITVEDKSHSQSAKNGLRLQLSAYITEVGKAAKGLKLVRNQSTCIDHYLFTQILNDLFRMVEGEYFGYRVPQNLLYTYTDDNNPVEIADLQQFLNEEIQSLVALQDVNYIVLKAFLADFMTRISSKFIE